MADLLILCYHAVSETWPANLSVRPDALRAQLRSLIGQGFAGTTLSDAVANPRAKPTVVVSFDDAFSSVGALARPILDELGIPGTLFVPTGHAGAGDRMSWPGIFQWQASPHGKELASLTWGEIRALAADGWEIGSHTHRHRRLTTLGEAELDAELRVSKEAIEWELGTTCRSLAYPYGDADTRVMAAAERAGYSMACGLPGNFSGDHRFCLPRIGVYQRDGASRFRLKTGRASRLLRRTRAWDVAEHARRTCFSRD